MIVDAAHFTPPSGPLFVAFEGINGCGKSTLLKNVSSTLSTKDIPHICTREPGGTALGEALRSLLLNWSGENKSPLAELLLFAADRAEHGAKVLRPSIALGKWVLCDRYLFSTVAFQGYGRGIDRALIDSTNSLATQDLLPDLVFLMDVDPEEGLRRAKARQSGNDSFENEEIAFHTRIREGFLECARTSLVPFVVVPGMNSKEENLALALSAFKGRI
jgi:dTMP kinase